MYEAVSGRVFLWAGWSYSVLSSKGAGNSGQSVWFRKTGPARLPPLGLVSETQGVDCKEGLKVCLRRELWWLCFAWCVVFPSVLYAAVAGYSVDHVDVVVTCPAQEQWMGNYGDLGSSQSVEGTGPASYGLNRGDETFWVVSAYFQKESPGAWNLTVSIVTGSTVHESASTTAEYGVAVVSWSYTVTGTGTLPRGIPGFPLAAVIVGLIGALTAGLVIRRRHR